MNGFRKMQERLTKEGWFVGWNLPCCQTCAWSELPYEHEEGPFKGQKVDLEKVLFNHSQDCEVEGSEEECGNCDGEGYDMDNDEDCSYCHGTGYEDFGDVDSNEFDTSVHGFVCNYPEQQKSSVFCFDGSKNGVQNLKDVLQLIEDCGCTVNWSGSGDQRIEISW
jgi:hypothetical protein